MSAPVTEYEIARGMSSIELANVVKDLIAQGWQPHGGVACEGGDGVYLYQALVRGGKQ